MSFNHRSCGKCAAATALRTAELPADATRHDDWLHQAAARFRSAMIFQIPVGFEDENGFHCGLKAEADSCLPDHESQHTF